MKIKDIRKEVEEMNTREKNILLAKILGAFESQEELNTIDSKSKNVVIESYKSVIRY